MIDRIRFWLTAAYVGILAVILVLFGVVAVVVFRGEAYDRQDRLLLDEASSRADSVQAGRYDDFLPAPGEPYAAWGRVTRDGRVVGSEPEDAGLLSSEQADRAIRSEQTALATVPGHEGDLRVATRPVWRNGRIVAVVQTGQLRAEVQGDVDRLILVLVPTGLGALVLATAGGLVMSRRAMRTVTEAFDRQRTFIADASHELKTPLTLIRADAEVLGRGTLAPRARALVDDLLLETGRMNDVLSDLLLLARLDAGTVDIAAERFDLGVVLDETRERFAALAEATGKRISVHWPDRVYARGDPRRSGQILAVLLDNALRVTPGGRQVAVTVRNGPAWVEIRVADAGPGFPPEHLPHVFERFYRADPARSQGEGGTGLGLAIAYDLARAQGGELVAENQASGAAVTLRLPAAPDANLDTGPR